MRRLPLHSPAAFALICLLTGSVWADHPLEIIELSARPAEELIPLIMPLVEPDGAVAGSGAKLFIRTDPQRLAEIQRLLQTLDHPPRNLLIQVRRDLEAIHVGGAIRSESGERKRTMDQEVRALDGRRAFIAMGTERPLGWREVQIAPGRVYERRGIDYRRAETGFYVLPRVVGEQVTLEIESFEDPPAGPAQMTASNTFATTVRGRLGDWIPLGGTVEDRNLVSAGPAGERGPFSSTRQSLSIRVTELP